MSRKSHKEGTMVKRRADEGEEEGRPRSHLTCCFSSIRLYFRNMFTPNVVHLLFMSQTDEM